MYEVPTNAGWSRWNAPGRRGLKWVAGVCAVLIVLVLAALPVIDKYWPYRYRNVLPLLQTVLASQIKIDHYHRTYFPHPGFVATGLTLRRNSAPDLPPVGTADRLVVEGRWMDFLLLRKHVKLVEVENLHIAIPPVGSRANQEDFPPGSSADFAGPATAVDELHMVNALLEIQRVNGGKYSFPIRDLLIRHLQQGRQITYAVDMQNAQPTGQILSKGKFGPLMPKDLGATPLSGDFQFAPVNLGDIGGISGTLSADGHFEGSIADVETSATSDTPDFAVSNGRKTHVRGALQCTVNALNGDVVMHRIEVRIGTTLVRVQGSVAGAPKVTDLTMQVAGGRVQDLLKPFFKAQAPLAGVVELESKVHVAPADKGDFYDRLLLQGRFSVPAERLTDKATERSLSAFSERAQGADSKDAEGSEGAEQDVVSELSGDVTVRNGMVLAKQISFNVPGAATQLSGTFNLRTSDARLTGHVAMDKDLSHVTTGFKSMLLKPLAPFFKRGDKGAVIPVAVTGGPGKYKITQNVVGKK
jgi:uncharacterized protein involved in outer membrane biogenesis